MIVANSTRSSRFGYVIEDILTHSLHEKKVIYPVMLTLDANCIDPH